MSVNQAQEGEWDMVCPGAMDPTPSELDLPTLRGSGESANRVIPPGGAPSTLPCPLHWLYTALKAGRPLEKWWAALRSMHSCSDKHLCGHFLERPAGSPCGAHLADLTRVLSATWYDQWACLAAPSNCFAAASGHG